jgi:hypothetical protein
MQSGTKRAWLVGGTAAAGLGYYYWTHKDNLGRHEDRAAREILQKGLSASEDQAIQLEVRRNLVMLTSIAPWTRN